MTVLSKEGLFRKFTFASNADDVDRSGSVMAKGRPSLVKIDNKLADMKLNKQLADMELDSYA